MKNRLLVIGIVLISTIALTLAYLTSTEDIKRNNKEKYVEKDLLAYSCKENIDNREKLALCVKEYISKSVENKGYKETEIDLEKSIEIYPFINKVCHPYAHIIGKGAFNESRNIKDAILNNTSFCAWGYMHGLYVAASEKYKDNELFDIALEGCLYLKEIKGNYYECAHGMGDAFVSSNGLDLLIGVSWCGKIEDKLIRQACSEGAANYYFDYRVNNVLKEDKSKATKVEKRILDKEDLYSVCREIKDDIDILGCMDYATHAQSIFPEGLSLYEKQCLNEKGIYNQGCYKGLGREYAFNFNLSDEMGLNKCLSSKYNEGVKDCTVAFIFSRTQIARDQKGEIFKKLCNKEYRGSKKGAEIGCSEVYRMLKSYFDKSFNI